MNLKRFVALRFEAKSLGVCYSHSLESLTSRKKIKVHAKNYRHSVFEKCIQKGFLAHVLLNILVLLYPQTNTFYWIFVIDQHRVCIIVK